MFGPVASMAPHEFCDLIGARLLLSWIAAKRRRTTTFRRASCVSVLEMSNRCITFAMIMNPSFGSLHGSDGLFGELRGPTSYIARGI